MTTAPDEERLPIPGFEDYSITKEGRVWSEKQQCYLKPYTTGRSHSANEVCLYKEGTGHSKSISTLLKQTWYPESETICTPKQWRIIRRQIGISQEALAKYLGVSKRAVENWETDCGKENHRPIPLEMYLKIKELHEALFQ